MKEYVTGNEIAKFLDKFSKDEVADMCQVIEKTVADAIQECNDKIQSIIQTYPEPFIMIGLKVDIIAEDNVIGKIAEVKIGSQRVHLKDDTTKTVDERIAQLYMAITEISHNLIALANRVAKLKEHNE